MSASLGVCQKAHERPLLVCQKAPEQLSGQSLWSDETKIGLFGHISQRRVEETRPEHPLYMPSLQSNTAVAASCCGDVFLQQELGD